MDIWSLRCTNSLLSNDVVTRVAITSVLKNYYHLLLFIPTNRPTYQLVSVRETKDLVEVALVYLKNRIIQTSCSAGYI